MDSLKEEKQSLINKIVLIIVDALSVVLCSFLGLLMRFEMDVSHIPGPYVMAVERMVPAFIVVIASFVTIIQMLMEAFVPALYAALGVFIPLIVVNCIILGRAEAFASKNSPLDSILDGVGIGLGFTLALTVMGAVREVLGSGAVFGVDLGISDLTPLVFVLAPGGFLTLGYLMVLFNKLVKK